MRDESCGRSEAHGHGSERSSSNTAAGEAMWWAERTQGAVSLGHAVALNNEPSKMSSACLVVEGMSGSVTPQTTAELSCATSG